MNEQWEQELDELTAELIDRQDELVALLNLADSTRNLLDAESALTAALKAVLGIVAAESGFAVLKKDGREWVASYPQDDNAVKRGVERGFDVQMQYERRDWIDNEWGLLGAPLVVDDAVCGVIGLERHKAGAFTYPHRKLLMAVAAQLSAHLDNIFLHEAIVAQTRTQAELDLARDVQLRLLPTKKVAVPHLDMVARTRPARAVGGDFYDYFEANGAFNFTVGDVSGKGMPAAMVMSMTKTLWNNLGKLNSGETPCWLTHTLNEAVYDDFTDTRMLATLFSGRFDAAERTIQFANAGHSPVIYMPAGGAPRMLEADGTALGVLTTCFCEDHTVTLGAGDVLVIGSDGFPEEENEQGEMFGYERLNECIDGARDGTAQQISDALFNALDQFSSTDKQFDDQTLIVLRGIV